MKPAITATLLLLITCVSQTFSEPGTVKTGAIVSFKDWDKAEFELVEIAEIANGAITFNIGGSLYGEKILGAALINIQNAFQIVFGSLGIKSETLPLEIGPYIGMDFNDSSTDYGLCANLISITF